MKKTSAVLIAGLLMHLGLSTQVLAFTPGTYDATAAGRNGSVTLHVEFDENSIVNITADHEETQGIGSTAIDDLIAEVLDSQSMPVDAVSGATVSSNAFLEALEDAVKQAGGQLDKKAEPKTGADAVFYETQADLIVVGGGAAGMTAATTAAEQGLRVILLEKSGSLGGNTLAAANGVNAADSKVQLADEAYTGAGASADGLKELQLQNDRAQENLVNAFAENSGEVIDWLSDMGVKFTVTIEKDDRNPIQNNYMLRADAAGSTGITMTKAVEKAMGETDVIVYKNMDATTLTQDENGMVTGVTAVDGSGQEVTFSGKAVLIATGGFGYNRELLGQVNEKLGKAVTDEIAPNTGEGLLMAQAVGAQAVDLGEIQTFPVVMEGYGMVTPNKLPGGFGVSAVIVNQEAERFTAEGFEIGDAILAQTDGAAYMIFREDQISPDMQTIIDAGYVSSAATAEELGAELGLDGSALQATVDAYNEDIADGTDDAFGKEGALPLEGTLYGFKYGVGAHYFMGGILINEKTQVLDGNNEPIPGLYAAGEVTGGFHGTQRIDGSGIGDSFTFGRIAGRTIATDIAE